VVDIGILGVMHLADEKYIKYIWVYDILGDRLEGFVPPEVKKHGTSKFKLKGARGKVILYKDKYYLSIWTVGYTGGYSDDIVERIRNRK
jgi:hypothetical protein